MTYGITKATLVAGIVLLAGCATSSSVRGKETDAVKARLDSLETQVAVLNQRVEEVAINQSVVSVPSGASVGLVRPARSFKARLTTRQIQKALASAGYYKGSVDGKEGPQTKKAVKAFQQARGLKADGVVGSATSAALSEYLNE
jgi:peptidoglycan hydrolase-like protein with peptidoglycan-binding domain